MFDDPRILWLIPGLPLLASVVIAILGPRLLKGQSHWPCILAVIASCGLSMGVFASVSDGVQGLRASYTWFQTGDVAIGVSLRVDGLTAVMLVTVTFIGSWIAIYSIGYMHHDPGYPRYFAEISLFLFSMTGLVLADNFVLLYAFWEGVGLCSYLLIGYYFAKPSAAAAARKAFLVTRLGDVGLLIGILLIYTALGPSLDYESVMPTGERAAPGVLCAICLLLFAGAVGKSAQFPLHVWLPDAMEGPSPVSALIHAATMVTAGVYLVARCTPLFGFSPTAQLVVACIGGFTALLAAVIALTQTDLKRVLAYSTISQLGYMFLALGSGTSHERLAGIAVAAAIFHLFTHAFFKALLFLGAGSVMHAMGGVIDMRRIGGLRKLMPTTHWTFLCGAGALSGFPIIFSGFWSKDEILAVAFKAGQPGSFANGVYILLFLLGLVTAGLTAFYTFRAYFLTFWGEERVPAEAGHHAHESPAVMLVPLMVLAAGAIVVGILLGPTGIFEHFLEEHWMRTAFPRLLPGPGAEHHGNLPLMIASSLFAVGGIGLAWWIYVRRPALSRELAQALPGAYELSKNKFYLDEIFAAVIVRPLAGLAHFLRVFDQYVVDSLVDLAAQVPRWLGHLFRPVQNGLVQFYALLMVLGLAGFLLSVLMR